MDPVRALSLCFSPFHSFASGSLEAAREHKQVAQSCRLARRDIQNVLTQLSVISSQGVPREQSDLGYEEKKVARAPATLFILGSSRRYLVSFITFYSFFRITQGRDQRKNRQQKVSHCSAGSIFIFGTSCQGVNLYMLLRLLMKRIVAARSDKNVRVLV